MLFYISSRYFHLRGFTLLLSKSDCIIIIFFLLMIETEEELKGLALSLFVLFSYIHKNKLAKIFYSLCSVSLIIARKHNK